MTTILSNFRAYFMSIAPSCHYQIQKIIAIIYLMSTEQEVTIVAFDPSLLKRLRSERRYSRERLSELSGISLRQIARLEQPSSRETTPRQRTLARLEEALNLHAGTLMGDREPPAPISQKPDGGKVRISADLPMQYRSAFDLVYRKYDITQEELLFLAPLLFTLAAEASLDWRKRKAKAAVKALETLEENIDHLDAPDAHGILYDLIHNEEDASDIWGRDIDGVDDGTPVSRWQRPLFCYLNDVAINLGGKSLTEITVYSDYAVGKCPHYTVLSGLLDELVEGSELAELAIWVGMARVPPAVMTLGADGAHPNSGTGHILDQLSANQIEALKKKLALMRENQSASGRESKSSDTSGDGATE